MCSSNTWNIKLAWWFQRYCQFHNGMMKGISNDGWHGSVSCFWCCKHAWNESVGRAPLGFPTKSSQHWQRLTPMFWPWLKLRPFRSFQYSMWCSATPRYFFYSMFNIFRYFAGKNDPNDPRHWSMEKPVLAMKHAACPWKVQGFPMGLTFFFLNITGNDHNFHGKIFRYFHCCLLYIPVNHIPIDWKKETIYASN